MADLTQTEEVDMYKKILIPIALDHSKSDKGVDPVAVARQLGGPDATLVLFHVVDDIPPFVMAEIPVELAERAFENAQADMAAKVESLGIDAQAVVVRGNAGVTIVDYAKDNGVDCIAMASHRPELVDYLLGSTAARVVRHATCSVHVIR
ncbi:MAG: universal stress protein [Pseudomonadota bacterium]